MINENWSKLFYQVFLFLLWRSPPPWLMTSLVFANRTFENLIWLNSAILFFAVRVEICFERVSLKGCKVYLLKMSHITPVSSRSRGLILKMDFSLRKNSFFSRRFAPWFYFFPLNFTHFSALFNLPSQFFPPPPSLVSTFTQTKTTILLKADFSGHTDV